MDEKKRNIHHLSEVEQHDSELIPEEFPEGPFGSSINRHEKVTGKSTPWKEGQRRASAYIYPDKDQHDDLPRRLPGSHPLHDE